MPESFVETSLYQHSPNQQGKVEHELEDNECWCNIADDPLVNRLDISTHEEEHQIVKAQEADFVKDLGQMRNSIVHGLNKYRVLKLDTINRQKCQNHEVLLVLQD